MRNIFFPHYLSGEPKKVRNLRLRTYMFSGGAYGTRTRDLLRDRQAF